MIVVDTSAILAILFKEDELPAFTRTLLDDDDALMGAPSLFEAVMVASRDYGAIGLSEVTGVVQAMAIRIVPWEPAHVRTANDAFLRYGKGQGHPAQLNFGDCMSYALAGSLDAPLLYKGGDFALTDIRSAL